MLPAFSMQDFTLLREVQHDLRRTIWCQDITQERQNARVVLSEF